jgi:FAD:protein FMN transferase
MAKWSFEAIGTHWDIDIYQKLSEAEESSLLRKIKKRIEIFDKDYSRFRSDSLISEISRKSGIYKMPDDFHEMISVYEKAYSLTDGNVTPFIGDVLISAGYDANYSLIKREMSVALKWEGEIKWQKPNLSINHPTMLDFGACGKGYLVDIVSEIMEDEGIKSYCVDASGDMRHRGQKEFRVGLEDPRDPSKVIGVVKIRNQSLCGSSGNRRKWADMHHIINPKTLKSPNHIQSVWVVSSETILSDILTTCLFFTDYENLKNHFNFECLILNENGTVFKTDGFNVELFYS